jgi:hypothetical protein
VAWCLDFHAPYRCRHAGACCRSGWTIPFEDGTVAARDAGGACTFLDSSARRCSVQRAYGLHALPLSCRMFPRIVLHDRRGTFVSLSHFCPTAARLLFDRTGEAAIVDAPPALVDIGELDGLDARAEWPPLLRAGVLMDLASYGAWERHAIALLTRDATSPGDALHTLGDVTARIAAWTPGSGALVDVVHASFDGVEGSFRLKAEATPEYTKGLDATVMAVKRWLAARLFGAWTAYQGDGLLATLSFVRACLETFTREAAIDGDAFEAIRRSDLRVLHS